MGRTHTAGEALLAALEAAGVSQALLAYRTDISTKHINQLIKGHCRISVDIAVRIESAVPGLMAEWLLVTQLQHELAAARQTQLSSSASAGEQPGG
jgi:HTH-type transcriptional regulator/antitoxin HigA